MISSQHGKIEKLEALRGFAALYVLLHHFKIGEGTYLQYFTMQGQVAVMLFFVLSGFVIYYSCHQKRSISFREYFIKRFRRIYFVFILALLISYLAACLNSRSWLPFMPIEFVKNLTNFQDLSRHPGYWFEGYYGNTPLWSISYEWWFYMLFFPIFKFVRASRQRFFAIGISILGFATYMIYPNQISIIMGYFICWWWGVEIAKIWLNNHKITFGRLKFINVSFVIMIVLSGAQLLLYRGTLSFGDHPIIELRHFIYAYVIIMFGLIWYKMRYPLYRFTFRPFIYFAPFSYAIYVFHHPIVTKYNFHLFHSIILQKVVFLFVLFGLAYFAEVILQRYVNRLTNQFIK